jgi:hypothetical protein
MLIDATRMKMSRLLSDDLKEDSVEFSPHMKWALIHGKEMDWIARIVLPH